MALLAILLRLQNETKEQGGISNAGMMANVAKLFEAILLLGHRATATIYLCMDPDCSVEPWPLKPQGVLPITCALQEGQLTWPDGLNGLPAEVQITMGMMPGQSSALLHVWRSLNDLKAPWRSSLAHQLLSQVGRHIDHCVATGMEETSGNVQSSDLGCHWSVSRMGHQLPSDGTGNLAMESELQLHREWFCKACGARPMFMSVAPDKSRVGAMGLQNCPVVLETGVGLAAPPAVALDKKKHKTKHPDFVFQ